MLSKKIRIGILSLLSLTLVPSAFAGPFDQPFGMIFGLFNDLFMAAEPYVGQNGFQRFMYWLLIFIAAYHGGRLGLAKGSDDEFKKIKPLVTTIAAILATAGAFAMNPDTMRSLGDLVAYIIPWSLLIGAFFYWFYRKTFAKDHHRLRHLARLLANMFAVATLSYLRDNVATTLSSSYLGNLAFQYVGLFFAIMTAYEIFMLIKNWNKDGSGGGGEDTTPPPVPAVIPPPVPPIDDHARVLGLISAYLTNVMAFEGTYNNPLRGLLTNVNANVALIRDPNFINAVNNAAHTAETNMRNLVAGLVAIRSHAGFASLTVPEKDNLDLGVARMTFDYSQLVNTYTNIMGHM